MYRANEITVEATGPLERALADALDRIVATGHRLGLTVTARTTATVATSTPPVSATRPQGPAASLQEGSFVLTGSGIARIQRGSPVPYAPRHRRDEGELRHLIALRDAARTVLGIQVQGGADEDLHAAQHHLADRYETYRRLHGPLNRYRAARTGRTDPETGEEILRRTRPRMGGFRDDPDWPLVAALEVFDDETQQARPAAIFTERVVSPPVARLGAETAPDALAVCLDETGRVDLDRIAELLGTDRHGARAELGELVYDDPTTGEAQPASQYLSGNVRHKLDVARQAAERNPRWHANVAALERVLPRQLEPSEITAGLGAPWIPAGDVEAFCREVLGAEVEIERLSALGHWSVALRAGRRASVSLSSEWGTARAE
jgi:N12 class adenine-specific DNA methylase